MQASRVKTTPGKNLVEESGYYWKGNPSVFYPKEKIRRHLPIAVDLFSGLGGLSLGFQMSAFQIALGLDIHAPSAETFRRAHRSAAVIIGDIRRIIGLEHANRGNLISQTLKEIIGNRRVDVLMAGIPCQGFSLSNRKRDLVDERNFLFLYFVECVKLIQPRFVLIENVSGLVSMNGGSFVDDIVSALATIGYNVTPKILNAADYGVPQLRKRVIFLGGERAGDFVWPAREYGMPSRPYRTVRDAMFDLPRLSAGEQDRDYVPDAVECNLQSLLRSSSTGLLNHIAPNHPQSVVYKIGSTAPGNPIYPRYTQRIRLSWDSPSPTQVSGGIRPQYQFGHPEDARGLTVRERCRIQTIPDDIEIIGGTVQGRVQTGNAVPPLLARAISRSIYFHLQIPKIRKAIRTLEADCYRPFPWRDGSLTAFQVLLVEILLRKTKAEAVAEHHHQIVTRFRDAESILLTRTSAIRRLLQPLGLSRIKSKALSELSASINETYAGKVPSTVEELQQLPHVGRYIASATLMFAYNRRTPIVDENIQRFFNRFASIPKAVEIHKADYLWSLSDALLPRSRFKQFAFTLLDFCAQICRPRKPDCSDCPLSHICHYQIMGGAS